MNKLDIFKNRLAKLNIELEFAGNFPWIYLTKINGKRVTEKLMGNHGFTVAFLPLKIDKPIVFTDLNKIFKLIRKYKDDL